MKFLKRNTNIDFMSKGRIALIISALMIVASIVSLATRGLNFGLDFTGGTLVEVNYPTAPQISDVREKLASAGLSDAVVQTFGTATDILIRIPLGSETKNDAEQVADDQLPARAESEAK